MGNEKGFTLFEMLIAFGLIMTISGLGMFGYGRMQARSEIITAGDEIRTLMRQAREKSVARIDDKEYRVVGASGVVTLETTDGVVVSTYRLRDLVTMAPTSFSFTFAKITGQVSGCGTGCVVDLSSGGLTETIQINELGLIR